MGKTSTWKLHYDDPNDIAKGRQQAQKLAESADAAISTCKEQVYQDYTGKIAQAESQANDYTDRQVQAAKVERNTQIDLVNKNIESNKRDIEQKLSAATADAIQREKRMKAEALSEANAFLTDRGPVNIDPDETWFTYKDAASLPPWPLASAPNNSIIFLYAVNSGTAWNVSVEAGQFYIFGKDKTGQTHYAQISNPYSLTRIVPLANDVVEFFTSEKASTKKLHARLAEAEAAIAGLKAELAELKNKQA